MYLATDESWLDDAIAKDERACRCWLRRSGNVCVPTEEVQRRRRRRRVRMQRKGEERVDKKKMEPEGGI